MNMRADRMRPDRRYASFPPLILGFGSFPPCPNRPTPESTLEAIDARRFVLIVETNPIVLELGYAPQGAGGGLGAIVWQPGQVFTPMLAALSRDFDAVRVSNFTAGSVAKVIINPA